MCCILSHVRLHCHMKLSKPCKIQAAGMHDMVVLWPQVEIIPGIPCNLVTALVRAALLSYRMPRLNQNACEHVYACTAGVCSSVLIMGSRGSRTKPVKEFEYSTHTVGEGTPRRLQAGAHEAVCGARGAPAGERGPRAHQRVVRERRAHGQGARPAGWPAEAAVQRLSMLVRISCAGFHLAQLCAFHALHALYSIAEVICACARCNLVSARCHTACTLYLPLLSCAIMPTVVMLQRRVKLTSRCLCRSPRVSRRPARRILRWAEGVWTAGDRPCACMRSRQEAAGGQGCAGHEQAWQIELLLLLSFAPLDTVDMLCT